MSATEARLASGSGCSIDCIFCGGDDSLGIVLEPKERDGRQIVPGMWNCFRCGEAGNTASLLQKVYNLAKAIPHDLSPLSEDRDLPEYILEAYGVVRALYSDQWWIPIFNEDNHLINIYKYDIDLKREGSPYAFLGCPGCSAGLFNVQTLGLPPPDTAITNGKLSSTRKTYPIYIAEGHWDTITLDHVLREAGKRSTCDVLGVPGANSFQTSWFRYVAGRPMVLLFDHDPPKERNGKIIQPGWDGIQRVIKLAKQAVEYRPSSVRVLEWSA